MPYRCQQKSCGHPCAYWENLSYKDSYGGPHPYSVPPPGKGELHERPIFSRTIHVVVEPVSGLAQLCLLTEVWFTKLAIHCCRCSLASPIGSSLGMINHIAISTMGRGLRTITLAEKLTGPQLSSNVRRRASIGNTYGLYVGFRYATI